MLYLLYSIVAFYVLGVVAGTSYKLTHTLAPVRWKDVFDPRKWLSVLRSAMFVRFIPPHIVEQLALRIYDDQCSACVSAGHCLDCGCAMPEKAFDPYAECSMGNWGPMILDPKEYREFRKKHKIKITVRYEQQ